MKNTLTCILASLATALTAAASPPLRIDMTIATSGDRIFSRPSFLIESGKRSWTGNRVQDSKGKILSEFRCTVTPTLLTDGTVDIQMTFTLRQGKKTDRHNPRVAVQLGELAKLRVGELVVTAKPTLVK